MCHSRPNNSKINTLHERCLRIIYSDKQSLYETSVSIHNRNLQFLATEMYKVSKGLSPPMILFKPWDEQHYNLRNNAELTIPVIKTVYHGS